MVAFGPPVHASVESHLLQRQGKYEFGVIDQERAH